MNYKAKFVQIWVSFANQWGLNRTMAQIHALLLTAEKPLNSDDIMQDLQISRGNVNMNIHSLMEWGLVYRQVIPGDRKDYFTAEKSMDKVAKLIIQERKRRTIVPLLADIKSLKNEQLSMENQPLSLALVEDIESVAQDVQEKLSIYLKE